MKFGLLINTTSQIPIDDSQVSSEDAVNIALDLKKRLVDEGRLDVSQGDMEALLFQIMQNYRYGDAFISRYRMMN